MSFFRLARILKLCILLMVFSQFTPSCWPLRVQTARLIKERGDTDALNLALNTKDNFYQAWMVLAVFPSNSCTPLRPTLVLFTSLSPSCAHLGIFSGNVFMSHILRHWSFFDQSKGDLKALVVDSITTQSLCWNELVSFHPCRNWWKNGCEEDWFW